MRERIRFITYLAPGIPLAFYEFLVRAMPQALGIPERERGPRARGHLRVDGVGGGCVRCEISANKAVTLRCSA